MLNNCVLAQDARRVLVKGRTYKERVEVDSDDEDIEVHREVIRTSVAVLDLETGVLEIVAQDGRSPVGSTGRAA